MTWAECSPYNEVESDEDDDYGYDYDYETAVNPGPSIEFTKGRSGPTRIKATFPGLPKGPLGWVCFFAILIVSLAVVGGLGMVMTHDQLANYVEVKRKIKLLSFT